MQGLTVLLQNMIVIAKCDVHYKVRQYRSIADLNKQFFQSKSIGISSKLKSSNQQS